jgi:hypothetical protein
MKKLKALKVRGVKERGKKNAFCELESLFFFLLFFHCFFFFAFQR